MSELSLIPQSEFARAREAGLDVVADMCRLNALTAVKRAGSGHLGSSFSAMDIVVFLLYEQLNTAQLGFDHPDRDVYFSSKGHDVPGLYAVLHSLGVVPTEKLLRLRRSGGLDGHPERACAGHRGELRLARHGHLEGPRHRLGEAAARQGRPRGRHGR